MTNTKKYLDYTGLGKVLDNIKSAYLGGITISKPSYYTYAEYIALEGNEGVTEEQFAALTSAQKLKANAQNVKTYIDDKVDALDATVTLGNDNSGRKLVFNGIQQENGKIVAVSGETLQANDIEFTAITASNDTVEVKGADVQAAIADIAKTVKASNQAQKEFKTVALTGDDLTVLGANVKEAYKLQVKDGSNDWADVTDSDVIKVYKDQNLKSVKWSGQTLYFTYILSGGTESEVGVNMGDIITESEYGDGLKVENHVISVKRDGTSEDFLTVGADGIKLSGVQDAIDAAVNGLDSSVSASTTNISMTVEEEDGKLKAASIAAQYATVERTATSSTSAAPKTDAALTVTNGAQLATGADVEKTAQYAADKAQEAKNAIEKQIADLSAEKSATTVAGVSATVATVAGNVSGVTVSVADNTVTAGGEKNNRTLTVTSDDNVIKGQAVGAIKTYIDNVVSDKTTDLAVSAAGDDYITAAVDSTDNKKINVTADVQALTVGKEGDADSTLSGVEKSLADGKDIANKVSSFVNARLGEEVAKLDATVSSDTTNVNVTVVETDGKLTSITVSEDYATVTRTARKTGDGAQTENFVVADGHTDKLIKASDLANAAAYAKDLYEHEVADRQAAIAALDADKTSDDAASVTVEVKEVDGVITDVIVANVSAGVNRTGDTANTRVLAATTGTGAVTGADIALIKGYVDDKVTDLDNSLVAITDAEILSLF